jgi:hypothetical protein
MLTAVLMRVARIGACLTSIAITLCGQSGVENSAPSSNGPNIVTMEECEASGNCGTWTIAGGSGIGQWPDGRLAILQVKSLKRLDDSSFSLVIHRIDVGSPHGIVGDYTGTLDDKSQVVGRFQSTNDGQPVSGGWYASPSAGAALTLPTIFHGCAADHCLTWNREGNVFVNRTNLPYQHDEVRTVEVRSFSGGYVSLSEYDTGSYPLTATWVGKVSTDNSEVVDGIMTITTWAGRPVRNGKAYPFMIAWGKALEMVPGQDGPTAPTGGNGPVIEELTTEQKIELTKIGVGFFEWAVDNYLRYSNNSK